MWNLNVRNRIYPITLLLFGSQNNVAFNFNPHVLELEETIKVEYRIGSLLDFQRAVLTV